MTLGVGPALWPSGESLLLDCPCVQDSFADCLRGFGALVTAELKFLLDLPHYQVLKLLRTKMGRPKSPILSSALALFESLERLQ
jgi:hypothetical protein